MRRLLLAAVAALAMFGTVQAQGSVPEGAFVRDESGTVFLVHGGERHQVPIFPATSEQLAAIPTSGRWLVPLADGSIAPGDRPEWDESGSSVGSPAGEGGSPHTDERMTFEGSRLKNTDPFWLRGGNYKLRWTASAESPTGCFHATTFTSVQSASRAFSGGSGMVEGRGPTSGESAAYRVQAGQYYLSSGSGCSKWRVTIETLR